MPAKRTGGRRVPVHMHNYKAPTPKSEHALCGVPLGNIAFTQAPKRVTCRRCLRLLSTWANLHNYGE